MKHRRPAWTPFELGTPATDPMGGRIFINSRYQINLRGIFTNIEPFGPTVEMSLKRRDKEPIFDWRDIQRIKNEVFGDQIYMVQVFPPEKYLVDTSNQYYFWVFLEYEFPFGFKERLVSDRPTIPSAHTNGVGRQRPFDEPHHVPPNLDADRAKFDAEWQKLEQHGLSILKKPDQV